MRARATPYIAYAHNFPIIPFLMRSQSYHLHISCYYDFVNQYLLYSVYICIEGHSGCGRLFPSCTVTRG